MKIIVSACLLGENCKYNGGNNYSKAIENYIKGHEVIRICPELLGGLEQSLGKKLLVRGKRKITLTEEGIFLRKRAENIVSLVDLLAPKLDDSVVFKPLEPALKVQNNLVWKRKNILSNPAKVFLEIVRQMTGTLSK